MLKKILAWVILGVLMAYVIFTGLWARGEARKNTCSGINIEILNSHSVDSLTQKGVLSELMQYPEKIIGEPIGSIDARKIEKYLSSNVQFENVTCHFTTDRQLNVQIQPMIPELRVFDDSLSYYINKEGKIMPSKANFFVDVPIASGKFGESFQAKALLPVSRFINSDPVLNPLISMIYAESADNIILIPRIRGHVINFGDTTRLEEKKEALLGMYRKVLPYKGWNEYDTISVKFKGQVVATRKNKNSRYRKYETIEDEDMEEATLPLIE